MNLSKNIKKAAKIEKKVLFKKVFAKISSKISNFFKERKDRKCPTYELYKDINLQVFNFDIPQNIVSNLDYIDRVGNNSFLFFGHEVKLETNKSSYPFSYERLSELHKKCFNSIQTTYNWDKDYIGNYQWNKSLWYKNISYGKVEGADIKVPWEIGRLQFLPPLAVQYTKNPSDEILTHIKNTILSFIAANPPRFGTQWMTSMDIAIRAINMLICLVILKKHKITVCTPEEETVVLSYLVDHGKHIEENLEYSQGMRGNHYFANIIGILACALLLDNYPDRKETISHYISELNKEVDFQFNSDGINFEASIPYHFFVLEMLDFAVLLSNNLKELTSSKISIPRETFETIDKVRNKFKKIREVSRSIIPNISHIPQLGDNDSGYLYNLYPTFDIKEIKLQSLLRMKISIAKAGFYHFEESGLYINKNQRYHFIMRCGKIGQNGKGGHDHNDHTSFEFFADNKPFIVDPGTFNYTAYHKDRNHYRSSYMHNTFLPINEEQNLFDSGSKDDLFWLSKVRTNSALKDVSINEVTAIHTAFHSVCMRKIHFDLNTISISDTIEKSGDKTLRLFLHPDVKIKKEKCCFVLNNGDTFIKVKCINDGEIKEYKYSPEYLQKEKAAYLEFTTHEKNIEWIIEIAE